MKIEIEVPEANILNALQSVRGAPYSGWVKTMEVETFLRTEDDEAPAGAERAAASFYLEYDREEDAEGAFGGKRHFNRKAINHGIAAMAKLAPAQFGALMGDGGAIDAVIADVLLQHIVFGKEVYA